jgi:FkbM family methyltransferase
MSLKRRFVHAPVAPPPHAAPSSPPPEPVNGSFELIESHLGGVWFRADDDVIRPAVHTSGHWEREEEDLLRKLIRPGCRFMDVGANIGWFSILASQAATGVSIDAIEPIPASLAALRMNLWAHAPTARVHALALGSSQGVVPMEEAAHNPGDARVVASAVAATVLTASVTGDELFQGRGFDVIKIDVQGAELDVLTGLQGTIARSPGLSCVVEFQPSAIVDRGERPEDTLRAYRSMGFGLAANVGGKLQVSTDVDILGVCESGGPNGFVNLLLTR